MYCSERSKTSPVLIALAASIAAVAVNATSDPHFPWSPTGLMIPQSRQSSYFRPASKGGIVLVKLKGNERHPEGFAGKSSINPIGTVQTAIQFFLFQKSTWKVMAQVLHIPVTISHTSQLSPQGWQVFFMSVYSLDLQAAFGFIQVVPVSN